MLVQVRWSGSPDPLRGRESQWGSCRTRGQPSKWRFMDRITRGKTRPGRLRRLDAWIHLAQPVTLDPGAWVVDLGVGANPDTTVEWFETLRGTHPDVHVLGTDIDAERVATAQMSTRPGLCFATAGFDVSDSVQRSPSLIRALNVLRQYRVDQVDQAHREMARALGVGGLLVEGTSDKAGDALVAHLIRKSTDGLVREGLWFSSCFQRGFAPMLFRDRLPRDLRDQVGVGGSLHPFFSAWQATFVRSKTGLGPAADFAASARALLSEGFLLDVRFVEQGHLVWTPTGGVPSQVTGNGGR